MRRHLMAASSLAGLALAACTLPAGSADPFVGFGPNPPLAAPRTALLPTVGVPAVVGWPAGAGPKAPAGFTVTRFAQGLVLVWYPQLLTRDSQNLPLRLRKIADDLAPRGWLHVRLTVQAPDEHGFGLIGSGMFIANPPFVLHDALRTALPFLAGAMGQIDEPTFLLEQRAA